MSRRRSSLEKQGRSLLNKAFTPMSNKNSYSPDLDSSDYLEGEELTYFQELIGILRWAIEIGRVDIFHEVSILSQFQAALREGQMDEILDISSLELRVHWIDMEIMSSRA